jgi:hypothetical protein
LSKSGYRIGIFDAPILSLFEHTGTMATGSRGISVKTAEDLGKRWRFFPTYTELQSGSVLRHISLECAISHA